jgi:hypothetical protein
MGIYASFCRFIGYGGRRCHACRTSWVTHHSPATGKHACPKCATGPDHDWSLGLTPAPEVVFAPQVVAIPEVAAVAEVAAVPKAAAA